MPNVHFSKLLVSTVNFVDLYIDPQNLALLVLLPRVNQCWLVAQYNCLEFKNFTIICLLKRNALMLVPKKIHSHFQFHLLLEVLYMEEPDHVFLTFFFLLNMCAPRIITLLVPVQRSLF